MTATVAIPAVASRAKRRAARAVRSSATPRSVSSRPASPPSHMPTASTWSPWIAIPVVALAPAAAWLRRTSASSALAAPSAVTVRAARLAGRRATTMAPRPADEQRHAAFRRSAEPSDVPSTSPSAAPDSATWSASDDGRADCRHEPGQRQEPTADGGVRRRDEEPDCSPAKKPDQAKEQVPAAGDRQGRRRAGSGSRPDGPRPGIRPGGRGRRGRADPEGERPGRRMPVHCRDRPPGNGVDTRAHVHHGRRRASARPRERPWPSRCSRHFRPCRAPGSSRALGLASPRT